MWPTLREFLAEGFYPIPPIPPPRPGSQTTRATGIRQPSSQSLDLIEATPGQHITIKTNFDILQPSQAASESRLNLDAPVSGEIPLQFARAAADSRNAAVLEGPNLMDESKRAYDIVNNLVRCTSGKEAVSLGKWTVVGNQTEPQAHLAFDHNHPGQTFVSGTPDATCAVDGRRETPAIALLESTVTAMFSDDRDLRRQKATLRSDEGMIVYMSQASRKSRTWNSYSRNGTAQFWVNFMAQVWEEMHQYRAECVVITSWKFTSSFKRMGANLIEVSPISNFDDDSTGRLNMLQISTAFAVSKVDDPLTAWTNHPGTPSSLRRDSEEPERTGDATPMPCPLPAAITISGMGENQSRSVAQLSLVYANDHGARDEFSKHAPKAGNYTLHSGEHIGSGRTYECYRVKDTNMVSVSGGSVAKVVQLEQFPVRDAKWKRSRVATREAVKAEAASYTGASKPSQGDAVPTFYGSWTGALTTPGRVESKDFAMPNGEKTEPCNEIMVMISEDVGRVIADRSEYVGDFDIVDIVSSYERSYSANVVHGDIGVKHIMKMGLGESRLIDFENAWEVDPDKPREYVDSSDEKRTSLREFKQIIPPELENLVPPWKME